MEIETKNKADKKCNIRDFCVRSEYGDRGVYIRRHIYEPYTRVREQTCLNDIVLIHLEEKIERKKRFSFSLIKTTTCKQLVTLIKYLALKGRRRKKNPKHFVFIWRSFQLQEIIGKNVVCKVCTRRWTA